MSTDHRINDAKEVERPCAQQIGYDNGPGSWVGVLTVCVTNLRSLDPNRIGGKMMSTRDSERRNSNREVISIE